MTGICPQQYYVGVMRCFHHTASIAAGCGCRISLAGLLAISAMLMTAPAIAVSDRPTVIELFSSQGCSSCGPANVYLGDLAKDDQIIALTFPVTYWDYLGWKDTFARREFDERQRAYARSDGSNQVYTPQIIIDGEHREAAGYPAIIGAVISYQLEERPPAVPVSLILVGKRIMVSINAGALPAGFASATVWLLPYDSHSTVSIKAGENRGRHEPYFNVVREMTPIGMWHGEPLQIGLPVKDMRNTGASGFAVLLQAEGTGPILGAAKMAFSILAD